MNLSYSVARYVPSLVRGEAINLGIALEAPDEDKLLVRFAGSLSRARLIFPDADVATLGLLRKYFTQTVESETTSAPVFGYSDLERLTLEGLVTECRNTVLQFSEPALTVADDARAELEDLYQTFVAPRIATAASVIRIPQMAPARVRRRLYDRLDRAGFIGPHRLQQQFRVRGRCTRGSSTWVMRTAGSMSSNRLPLPDPRMLPPRGRFSWRPKSMTSGRPTIRSAE
jgi:Protein of unknown function (DUF3037)